MLQMGMLFMSMKKYDKAIEIYTAILADRPDEVDAIRGRADVQLNSGHRSEAVADYERALKLKPDYVGILNNLPGPWRPPRRKVSATAIALALATDASRQTEYKQDFILSTLAAAYAETGDFESARKWAARPSRLNPTRMRNRRARMN